MRSRVVLYVLLLLIFSSSIALVDVRFKGRALNAALAELGAEGRNLRRENRRLQIELTTFSDLREVHGRSVKELGMVFPRIVDGTMMLVSPRR